MANWTSALIGSDLISFPTQVFSSIFSPSPWLAEVAESEAEIEPLVLASVLLSLIVIYLAAKLGGELCARINLPSVLGELVGGVIVGVSAMHLIVFPEGGAEVNSLLMNVVGMTAGQSPEGLMRVFQGESEVISVLAELGVI
ncbi:MAG: hypothetical protein WBG38_10195, partial [Nodosilinea sp.]